MIGDAGSVSKTLPVRTFQELDRQGQRPSLQGPQQGQGLDLQGQGQGPTRCLATA